MIIDLILDRKDGCNYSPRVFYHRVCEYGDIGNSIASALDGGTNKEIQNALCEYIDEGEYNPDIKDYIESVRWI